MAGTARWLPAMAAAVAVGTAAAADAGPSFASLDRNGDGRLSADEAAARHGLPELMADYDRDRDGRLDREEFQALLDDAAREARRVEARAEETD